MEKVDSLNVRDQLIPERLQQDVERSLNYKFSKALKKLADRTYIDNVCNLASINFSKYLLSKPCI